MSKDSEEDKGLGIKPVQVLAYALAAIASAVLGSFFGFSGTVIGAGVASVISTVGAAVFQRGAEKTTEAAKKAARNTGALRAQPSTARASGAQSPNAQSPNAQSPGTRQAQQPQQAQRTQQGPQPYQQPRTSPLQQNTPGRATTARAYRPVDPTEQIANLATPMHEQRTRYMGPSGPAQQPTQQQRTQQQGVPTGHRPPAEPEAQAGPPWWRRHLKLLVGMFVLVFVIGVGGVSAIELLSGGPLSGGQGGTSFGRLVSGDTSTKNKDQSPSEQDKNTGGSPNGTEETGTTTTTTRETTTTTAPTRETGGNEQPTGQNDQQGQQQYQNPQGKNAPETTPGAG
ncbi:hypothetical protein [Sciscionella sediminilitoris]|uniref:hypothetical protein n=1 Tax=Sciscionella sediminilitoris TaxID=1445613 RepID=UPI0004DECE52|nr:hypothetical protein [Sciscionella sp. SE31]